MPVSFKYWDDCLDPDDMRLMWADPHVSKEWIDAGEEQGQKVHLSRDPDGEAYLTQTEIMVVAAITVQRHFKSQLDPYMIGALAEIASGKRLFVDNYHRKTKETKMGIMQVTPEVAQWLARERTEEFVVRAYKGGKKKATHKSSAPIFERYLYVKETLLSMRQPDSFNELAPDLLENSSTAGTQLVYWDSKVSEEDIGGMWSQPDVLKEWTNSGEQRGNVRFSHDAKKRPYLSRVEVKAVAEIIISRHFSSRGVKPEALAALAEVCSMRFVHGVRSRTGLMGIDYPTAAWLSRDCGYTAYAVSSVDDLYNPFASMYFGAAYLGWLSRYEGRERSHEFIVQAYLGGPDKVNLQETGPYWKKFLEALIHYEDPKKDQTSCCIL
ncbi:hypothetical protein CFC21_087744 [Triticum aestivum]|uniref:Transglycosylase SLT domain-containing protein n=2 Tax=Triticum aestivum TaxID=4565 RepID=A0A3B6PLE6_WHEAT|nr:uncharacterized protein LOC123136649 isoform X2 [Triticum aestivum]KAF7084049.1 hypothetical protein CFC21_087744 [Triticum aestivum]